ncbi:MAG TPA: NfeD family protein [Acidimicrobiales bacterium]|nr:NfeD family protein [Acidimicrobiales bacterium]
MAGVLLGLVVLASLAGFHTGPHGHVAAGVIGVVAAGWLLAMWASGQGRPLLYVLFAADLVVSVGVATSAWRGIAALRSRPASGAPGTLAGAEGVALSDLRPDGIVRVRGETWSATALNGHVSAGTPIQVIQADGVRLGVWGEEVLREDPPRQGVPASTTAVGPVADAGDVSRPAGTVVESSPEARATGADEGSTRS